MKKRPMTDELVQAVWRRDGMCVAARLRAPGFCRSKWGDVILATSVHLMTMEHVQDRYGSMGLRAVNDEEHVVVICWGHGVQGWELSHKALLRRYLAFVQKSPAFIAAKLALDDA